MSYVKNKKMKIEEAFKDFDSRDAIRKAKRKMHSIYTKKWKAELSLPEAERPPRRQYEFEKALRPSSKRK